jgi:Rieske Fe-S protein
VGQKAIVKGKNYICVKNKGKLSWKLLTPAKPAIIVHPSSTPTTTPSKVSGFLVAHLADLSEGVSKVVVAKDLHGRSVGVALFLSGGVVSAHSAICTHQGCQVGNSGKQLACPCHGSVFDAKSGAVVSGPAGSPLQAFTIAQVGGDLYITSEG